MLVGNNGQQRLGVDHHPASLPLEKGTHCTYIYLCKLVSAGYQRLTKYLYLGHFGDTKARLVE